MTEYEEASEAIAKILASFYLEYPLETIKVHWLLASEDQKDRFRNDADQILKLPNIAVIAKDQGYPDIEDFCQQIQGLDAYTERMSAYRKSRQDMLKANFKRVIEI